MPSEQMVTEAPSARSICERDHLVGQIVLGEEDARPPARFAAAPGGAPPAGRRSTASAPPPGRSPRLTEPPSPAASGADDIETARPVAGRAGRARPPCGSEARALVGDAEDDLARRVRRDREPRPCPSARSAWRCRAGCRGSAPARPGRPQRRRHAPRRPDRRGQPARPRLRGVDRAAPHDELSRSASLLDDRRLAAHGARRGRPACRAASRGLVDAARASARRGPPPRRRRARRAPRRARRVDVMAQKGHLARVRGGPAGGSGSGPARGRRRS